MRTTEQFLDNEAMGQMHRNTNMLNLTSLTGKKINRSKELDANISLLKKYKFNHLYDLVYLNITGQ